MAVFDLPLSWDATKFAARYSLNLHRDFYVRTDGKLEVFPLLPDNPPIFEAPDAPKPSVSTRLDAVKTLPELIALLKEELA